MMNSIGLIIGCGRSGTSWLGQIFNQSVGFSVTIEQPVIFRLVDHMALNSNTIPFLMPPLISLYRELINQSAPKMYIDKSHQNIWLVEHLSEAFDGARFIGIQRSSYGTIASMLQHQGALTHFKRWRLYPIPNRHIGLPENLVREYDHFPPLVKCALRWSSHHNRMSYLQKYFSDRLLVLNYEDLVQHSSRECRRISHFLGQEISLPDIDRRPLDKWKAVLSKEQLRTIDKVVGSIDMSWIHQYKR
jgi:Sulfotransferase domain